jgi:hypothetical protein
MTMTIMCGQQVFEMIKSDTDIYIIYWYKGEDFKI